MKKLHFTIIPWLFAALLILTDVSGVIAQTKISDLARVRDANDVEVIGYGLVTGLDRSGDRTLSRQGSAFTVQSIANMLQNFGITVDPTYLRTRNVAAVMVTARISPYHSPGSNVDVTVSSLGDASSLVGGVLLQTPLINPNDQEMYVMAQGPLVVGGISAETPGARVMRNQTLTATIPSGGSVQTGEVFELDRTRPLGLILKQPNYQNAQRIVNVINETFDQDIARTFNAGMIEVNWPPQFQGLGELNEFASIVLDLEIDVDTPARVVINERTGTIVAGGNIRIDEVLISHGSVQIQTQRTPFVAQPAPLSLGQTVVGEVASAGIGEQRAQTIVLEPNTTVTALAASLNELGLSPRDIISIFQAIDRAGALRGTLIVM